MKISTGKIALLLWAVTIVSAVVFLVKGPAPGVSSDGRSVIQLSDDDRNLVLAEMRLMLQSTQEITSGVAEQDMSAVAKAAKKAGMGSAIDLDPNFLAKLPLEFKALGFSMHADMDAIADAANRGETPQGVSRMLSNTLMKCTACHDAWKLESKR